MKKKLPALMIAVGAILLLVSLLWLLRSQQYGSAALLVEVAPDSNVYVNGELVGTTPYEGEFQSGEISLQLIPLAFDSPRVPFDSTVKLTSRVRTIVRRELGETINDSTGEVISYEQTGGAGAAITVVTRPDNALVTLNGGDSDTSPVRFGNISDGEYKMLITAEGYEDRSFTVVAVGGYTTTAIVDLKRKVVETAVTAQRSQTIRILETPVGFLRVRAEASTASVEIGQVETGNEFSILETSENGEWYKITINEDAEGWVSSEYVEIIS